jgi:hypothetical protein
MHIGIGGFMRCGGGVAYTSQYQTLYNALTTKPSSVIAVQQNLLVKTLYDEGIWAKYDRIFNFAQTINSAGEALKDWIDPTRTAAFGSTGGSNPAFTALRGIQNSSVNKSFTDTQFIPSVGVNFLQNNASIFLYVLNNAQDNGWDIATYDGTGYSQILVRNTADGSSVALNGPEVITISANSSGLWVFNRISSTQIDVYRNGSKIGVTLTSNSAVLSTISYYLGSRHNTGASTVWSDREYAMLGFGGTLTSGEITILTNAIETYMDSNGQGVI